MGVHTAFVLCVLAVIAAARALSPPSYITSAASTPLVEWPMITTHDAGTSYYASKTCSWLSPEANYVMTQMPGTITQQLDCGARAFDLRLHQDGGKLVMHHDAFVIDHAVSDVLNEIVQWTGRNKDEFVLIIGSHCNGGDDCQQMFYDVLASANIHLLECNEIMGLTLGSAMQRGRLASGGTVLATMGCVEENWDSSITCYGNIGQNVTTRGGNLSHGDGSRAAGVVTSQLPESIYCCWGYDSAEAFDPLWSYMTRISDGRGRSQELLWMAQAHWQSTANSVVQGDLSGSCILEDESKSSVNSKLTQRISQGSFPHINLLEIDNVCGGHGPDLLKALRSRFIYDVGEEAVTNVIV